jgi:hypothetical protein
MACTKVAYLSRWQHFLCALGIYQRIDIVNGARRAEGGVCAECAKSCIENCHGTCYCNVYTGRCLCES